MISWCLKLVYLLLAHLGHIQLSGRIAQGSLFDDWLAWSGIEGYFKRGVRTRQRPYCSYPETATPQYALMNA